jgi:hypothetical protein
MTDRNKIVYGQWTFLDKDIKSGNMYLAMSLMSDSLEANTFSATVECSDKTILDFERNAPLTYYSRGRQKGIFYIQSITRVGPTEYTLSATSAIGLLIEGLHYGGIYTGQTVAEVLPSICGTVPYVIKMDLRDIALYGWLPVATPRDNLSQVLFAIGASIKTDLDGVLHIESLWNGISGTFGKDRMYQGPSVDYTSKVTQVVVTEHQYVEGGDETELFSGSTQEGDVITFDEPMYNLQATGFTILESNANYAKVSAGSGTLKGNAYIHNTRQVAQDVLTANESNVKTVTKATLVSLVNSYAVTERVANYYKSTQTINANAVYQGENPGDLLSTWHPYDLEAVSSCLQSADISISNTLKSEETLLVGFTPLEQEQTVTYDQRELLVSSGTWTVPTGVNQVRAILIGGGNAGNQGGAGKSGGGSQNGSLGTGGAGGQGGEGGAGGKVYDVTIEVTPGQQIVYSIGSGGESSGSVGGDTTFGAYTSADGGTLPNGYVDLVTQEVFAKSGYSGYSGDDGPSGNSRGNMDMSLRVNINRNGAISYKIGTTTKGGYSGDESWMNGGTASNGSSDPNFNIELDEENKIARVPIYIFYPVASIPKGKNGNSGSQGAFYGDGGNGGSGGDGGPGAPGCSVSYSVGSTFGSYSGRSLVVKSIKIDSVRGGYGGSGGSGGAGADGCIILYYGVQKIIQTGPIVTSKNKYFLDKNRRRLVV